MYSVYGRARKSAGILPKVNNKHNCCPSRGYAFSVVGFSSNAVLKRFDEKLTNPNTATKIVFVGVANMTTFCSIFFIRGWAVGGLL